MKRIFSIYTPIILMVFLTAYYLFSTSNQSYANPVGDSNLTIVDIASNNKDFSILVAALVKADLVAPLEDVGPYTVFAPTNEAFKELFKKLKVSGLEDLTASQLSPILLYHVVQGEVMSKDVKSGMVPTLNPDGAKLNISVYNTGIQINKKTKVIQADIKARNGVIHVIDKVLLP